MTTLPTCCDATKNINMFSNQEFEVSPSDDTDIIDIKNAVEKIISTIECSCSPELNEISFPDIIYSLPKLDSPSFDPRSVLSSSTPLQLTNDKLVKSPNLTTPKLTITTRVCRPRRVLKYTSTKDKSGPCARD